MISHFPALKAIFFDLDNVLVFSETTHFKAWQKVVQQLGISPEQLDFQKMIGLSDSIQAQQFKDRFNLAESADTILEMKKSTYLKLIPGGLDVPLGRDAFLKKLSGTYTLGVVSSCHREAVHYVLQNENIASFFDFVICHEDCERHKPDPEPYQKALTLANVEPHEALVFEDSYYGITAAQRADIPVIGIFKDQAPDQMHANVKYYNHFEEINDLFYTPITAPPLDLKAHGA